jgi:hypothetical protein
MEQAGETQRNTAILDMSGVNLKRGVALYGESMRTGEGCVQVGAQYPKFLSSGGSDGERASCVLHAGGAGGHAKWRHRASGAYDLGAAGVVGEDWGCCALRGGASRSAARG